MSTRLTPKETGREGVMRAVTDLLTAERLLWFRMNAGDHIVAATYKRYRIKGHAAGTADILFFIGARPVWCECKRIGESLTEEQERFADDVMQDGHTFIVIDDPTQLQTWLKEHR